MAMKKFNNDELGNVSGGWYARNDNAFSFRRDEKEKLRNLGYEFCDWEDFYVDSKAIPGTRVNIRSCGVIDPKGNRVSKAEITRILGPAENES